MPPEIPEHCPQPDRPCQWERERNSMDRRLSRMERQLTEIHAALAVGSERFKNQVELMKALENQEVEIKQLTLLVSRLAQTVGILRTLVFGGVGLTLVAVIGALLSLVIIKGV